MTLQIYNTLKRAKQPFVPLEPNKISMYVCGNTVYDYAHIGHARVMVSFDVIVRYLRSQGWDVKYVRNFTDIDDKILRRAAENGEYYTDLTARMIDAQHEDERALGISPPDLEPRATDHIDDIVDIVQTLVDNHYAYVADNHDVYFRVKRFPEYGKLSGKKLDELLAGARVEVEELKEDPRDFALWKAAPAEEPGWESPWGWGRPGWHIECSAMSTVHLGETLDIHGGGPDLVFPHHENEIAQSESANHKHLANVWMHAGAVRVDNEKMSKSLGNFFTIREVLEKYHPEVVRFFLISSHYRSPINYSEDNLIEAKAGLERFYAALRGIEGVYDISHGELAKTPIYQRFVKSMNDDFNTREAIAALYELVKDLNNAKRDGDQNSALVLASQLKAMGDILGIFQADPERWFKGYGLAEGMPAEEIELLIAQRVAAKSDKNYALADQIRQDLKARGVELEDGKDGTIWRRV
jgi:cysteinyl-tRNA synthetase